MTVGEDEDALTLQEALAFIDACEVDEEASVTSQDSFSPASSGGRTGTSTGTSTGASSDDGDARAAMVQEKLKRKKARNSLAVMRCQRKKKQAVIDLREQVAELEGQLSKLRRRQVSNGVRHDLQSGDGALDAVWEDLARRELLERQEAEALNRDLKVALLKQTQLSQALRQLANVGALDHDLASMMRESLPSPLYSAPRKVFSMDYVLADLELAMKKLYIDATHALQTPVATNSSAEYFHMKHERHHHYGEYINLKRVSTVPMPIERVGETIWTGMMTYHTDNPSYTLKSRSTGATRGNKTYTLSLGDFDGRLSIDGISYQQRFDEVDRLLLAFTSLVTITDQEGISFREKSWMQITRCPSNPSGAAIVSSCYQLSADCPALVTPSDHPSPTTHDLKQIQTLVFESMGAKIKQESKGFYDILSREALRFRAE